MEKTEPTHDPKKGKGSERALAAPGSEWRSSWVILPAIPMVISNEKNHLVPGTDVSLHFEEPPRTTILTISEHISDKLSFSSSQIPYIINVRSSGKLLIHATKGRHSASTYYIVDAHTGIATPLPPSLEQPIWSRWSVGFIEDPRHCGHHLVVQLHPMSTNQHKSLV
uniref:Uncharacterized protein n=1 Tax=Leersia perrieri TaxID=77586 RepID=A0A0D9UYZ7_9ORYZ